MLNRTLRRMPLVLFALLAATACDKDPPVPAPEQNAAKTEIAPPFDSVAPSPSPAPESDKKPADPSAQKAPEAPAEQKHPEPSAEAKPAAGTAGTAGAAAAGNGGGDKAAPQTTPPAIAPDAKIAAPGSVVKSSAPAAKNGILAPGEADKFLALGAKPSVRLMSPGAEPRAPLAYDLEQGSKHKLDMGMDMLMSIRMGEQAVPATSVPRIVMGLDMLIAEKGALGDWKVDANLNRASIEPKGDQQKAIAAQMGASIDGMKGMRMSYWVTPKGHVRDVKLDLPESFPAQAQQMLQGMNQSFESMMAPLPEDPVGIGATWEVVTRVASSGADLVQFATYTLKKKTGSKALLEVQVKQLAAKATITAPGLPAGALARLLVFKSEGSGTNEIDTKSVAPASGKMLVKSGMTLEVSGAGGPAQETSMETTLTVTFTKPKN